MKHILWTVLFIFLASFTFADCVDSDGGPTVPNNPSEGSLSMKGVTKLDPGITENVDVCLTDPSGVSTNKSDYLKEYYCDGSDVAFKVYKCSHYGFVDCRNGACFKNSSSFNSGSDDNNNNDAGFCGDKIMQKDLGEECDPPGSICFGSDASEYGQCLDSCKCKLANAVASKCGNGIIDDGETCETDSDCLSSEYCKNCICVATPQNNATNNTLTKSSNNSVSNVSATTNTDSDVSDVTNNDSIEDEIDKKYPIPVLPEINMSAKNFSDDPGIKTVNKVSKFFTNVWDFVIRLFT